MELNQLSDRAGARRARTRRGRGIGSGKGKTAGRGHKGQKSREGVSLQGFEGGQMPIYRRLPKHGFTNIFREELVPLSLGRLQSLIDASRLDASAKIDLAALIKSGVVKNDRRGVKVLGDGELKAKVDLEVSGASARAREAIEKAGGSVTLVSRLQQARALRAEAGGEGARRTERKAKSEKPQTPQAAPGNPSDGKTVKAKGEGSVKAMPASKEGSSAASASSPPLTGSNDKPSSDDH